MVNRISIKLKRRMLSKFAKWAEYGFSGSDVLRIALALLPEDPSEIIGSKADSTASSEDRKQRIATDPDAKAVLKKLQDW